METEFSRERAWENFVLFEWKAMENSTGKLFGNAFTESLRQGYSAAGKSKMY